MKLSLVFVAALAAVPFASGCAVSTNEADVGSSAESDLTKVSVQKLGSIEVGEPMNGGSVELLKDASSNLRAYEFSVVAGSAVDIRVTGDAPEALILDAKKNVLARATVESDSEETRAIIKGFTFDKDGTYLLAFREAGDAAKKTYRWVELNRNYDKAPITHIACKTREKFDGEIETIDFDVAYMKPAKISSTLLPVKDSGPDEGIYFKGREENGYGYVGTLNENMGYQTNDGRLVVSGDADGIYLVELVLFENSELKKGFFRVYNNSEGKDMYSEVDCTVTEKIGR